MRKNTFLQLALLIIISIVLLNCQNNTNGQNENINLSKKYFYVSNYNVENLFDTIDDEGKIDEWFTPSSEINWTEDKLQSKIINLTKVIEWMNNGEGPDLLGLEEVEHKSLLERLLNNIQLKKNYKIVHFESPDKRGIDNAIIYNSGIFHLEESEAIPVLLEGNKTTRDILYAKFKINDQFINFYVNHWPSRREGLKKSEPNRIAAAKTLKMHIEKLPNKNKSNIIIVGDFNDMPSNLSISKILNVKEVNCELNNNYFELLNLSTKEFKKGHGSYKYKDHWNMLDQIIVSNPLLDNSEIDYNCNSFEILKPEFILQKKGKYKGTSLPTFGGRKYLGGFSDHFAVGASFIY